MLSIIIVNYNVKLLLEQCLQSVIKASEKIETEVWVVDNASSDDSVNYLRERFPFCRFISNTINEGFARANNRVLPQVSGKYILFLNPDTVVPEDCFIKCIDFFDAHPMAGALGVKMINGKGEFLKESKRGFPSPMVSFCKLSGLAAVFPRSSTIARYYLGHLNENETHEVDVLSGAFMMVKKEVLDKTGGFDERFFMYAEDIDLSYRITQQGYKNYYLAETTIIHYKGSSTRKDTAYTKQFYKAMTQFVKKYYGSGIYSGLLGVAIKLKTWSDIIFKRR